MSVWIAETLLATTLLMALVMMVRRPVARWLGAGPAYMLWALPLARMALPALPAGVDPSPLHLAIDQAGFTDYVSLTPAAAPVVTEAASFPWLETAIGLWFVGMIAFLVIQAVGYVRFRKLMLAGSTDLGREGRIRLVTSPNASGPLAFGVFHPHIVLPVDFALRYDAQEQDMAIAHERAHHERGDLVANMIALLLLAIHWCNPVAWLAYRAYRTDQETACDARVLSLYGRENAHAYGRAILKAAGGRQYAAACHLTRINALKGRLKMLSNHDVSLQRISWGMAAVAIVTASGLALTASGSSAAQKMAAITEKVETADLARLTDLVAKPAAVSAPAAVTAPSTPSVPAAPASPRTPLWSKVTVPSAPAAPVAPIVPAADMIAPVPPTPPAPPSFQKEMRRTLVTHSDGRVEAITVPSYREIASRTPVVDVREGCDEGRNATSRSEYTDSNGRRHIRVRICTAGVERAAEQAGRMAERNARLAEIEAERAERRAEQQAAQAERMAEIQAEAASRHADYAARQAESARRASRITALNQMRRARASLVANTAIPEDARHQALRSIDRSIAEMRDDAD